MSAITHTDYKANYKSIKIIGKGSYGAVEKIQNIATGQFYALKRITILQNDDLAFAIQEIINSLKTESKYIVKIFYFFVGKTQATPFNVKIYGYGNQYNQCSNNEVGIIMELGNCSLLDDIIKRKQQNK